MILLSCTYCEENSFDLSLSTARSINTASSLSDENVQLLINNGAEYTRDKMVNLTFTPSKDADEMLISFSSDCSSGSWEPLETSKIMELTTLNRKVSGYVKYRFLGEEETACVGDSIIHDDIEPEVDFVNPPSAWIAASEVSIGMQASDEGGSGVELIQTFSVHSHGNEGGDGEVKVIQCDLQEEGQLETCSHEMTYKSLVEGQNYILGIRAQDKAGNYSSPKQVNWRSDQTPPSLSLNLGPSARTADVTPDFSFLSIDTGSGVSHLECRIDSATRFSTCENEFSLSNLTDGAHSIEVKAIDKVGRSSEPVTHNWTQGTAVPTIRFTDNPASISKDEVARFEFSGINTQQGIVSYQCQLDSGAVESCTSPHDLKDLSDGNHVFSVVGSNTVGLNSSPIVYRWLVDRSKPTLKLVSKPSKNTRLKMALFVFQASDAGSGIKEIRCKVDNDPYEACPQVMEKRDLAEGSHTIVAKSIDNADNESDEISYQWTVDGFLPTVKINSTPSNPTKEQGAIFSFEAGDNGSGIKKVECRLDENPFETCDNTKEYAGLSEGEHQFTVRSEDNAGNFSSEESYTWLVDITDPDLQFSSPPSIVYIGQTASIQFSASDAGSGVSHYQCSFNGSVYPCEEDSLVSLSATSTQENSFEVKVFDNAGNERTETLTWQTKIEAEAKQIAQEVLGEVPIDILFVVDTSNSMHDERANLADKIDGFIEQIKDLDWQLAATTTDIDDAREQGADHTQGRLTDFSDNDTGVHILDSSMDVDEAQDDFGYSIQRFPYQRSLDEKGIGAVYQAIERYNNNESPHTDFFREGAHLAVVVLSDEEAQGGSAYTPQKFLDFVKTSFTNKTVGWHSIIHTEGDDCDRDRWASNGTRYEELSRVTNGVVGRVCDDNYTSQLTDMGKAVKNLQKEVALGCTPLDDDLDGNIDMEVKFKASGSSSYQTYSGTYTIQADKQRLVFDKFLKVGDYQFNFKCAKN